MMWQQLCRVLKSGVAQRYMRAVQDVRWDSGQEQSRIDRCETGVGFHQGFYFILFLLYKLWKLTDEVKKEVWTKHKRDARQMKRRRSRIIEGVCSLKKTRFTRCLWGLSQIQRFGGIVVKTMEVIWSWQRWRCWDFHLQCLEWTGLQRIGFRKNSLKELSGLWDREWSCLSETNESERNKRKCLKLREENTRTEMETGKWKKR